jgi:hypothetical protein
VAGDEDDAVDRGSELCAYGFEGKTDPGHEHERLDPG